MRIKQRQTSADTPNQCTRNWCPFRESDPGPLPYQGSALPLSQMGFCGPVNKNRSDNIYKSTNTPTMERGRRIELLALAWKAKVLPLYEPRAILPGKLQWRQFAHKGTRPTASQSINTGGEGWIRTSVLVRGQIYSLLPLTTRPPLHGEPRIMP